jgi:DNA-binding beta-propeller fold protein YncE
MSVNQLQEAGLGLDGGAGEALISLVAGRGVAGVLGDGGAAVAAQLNAPTGVVVDRAGGILVADASNRIRRIAFGAITTIAGSGATGFGGDDGIAIDAQLNLTVAVAIDTTGAVLIADQHNHRIRRVDLGGTITTIAGGGFRLPFEEGVPATEAILNSPAGIWVDDDGDLLIVDTGHHVIRRVDSDGLISTVAGIADASGFAGDGGPATRAKLNHPTRVAVGHGGELLIADRDNHRIRRVGPNGKISTIAGTGLAAFGGDGGPATDAFLNFPTDVLPDGAHDFLIVDTSNDRVRNVDRDGVITTIAGGGTQPPADGLPATSVLLTGVAVAHDRAGGLLVCDEVGHRLWRLTPQAPA